MNNFNFEDYIHRQHISLIEVLQESNNSDVVNVQLKTLFEMFKKCITQKNKVVFFGNGGSAAEATHIAGEFTSFCLKKHKPWGAISLNDSISSLTSIPNDFTFEEIFAIQVSGLVQANDVVVGLSTSGVSKNVLNGLKEAKIIGARTVLLTSKKCREDDFFDLTIRAASEETTRIQEIHLFWLHSVIEQLEINL